jgi:hypothetical protein
VAEPFVPIAGAVIRSLGLPQLPLVILPYPLATRDGEEMRSLAAATFEQVMACVLAEKGA